MFLWSQKKVSAYKLINVIGRNILLKKIVFSLNNFLKEVFPLFQANVPFFPHKRNIGLEWVKMFMTVWFSKAVSGTCSTCKLWQKKYGYLETVLNTIRLSIHTWAAMSQEQLTKYTYAESVTKFLGTLWKSQFLEKNQNLDPRFTNL